MELFSKTCVTRSFDACLCRHASPIRGADDQIQALCRSKSARERTKLIVFLGTPHRGSPALGWGQIALNLACIALQELDKEVLETLEVDDEFLDDMQETFTAMISDCGIMVHSFQETSGISGLSDVDEEVLSL